MMVTVQGRTERINDIKYYGWAIYTVTLSSLDEFTATEFVDTENLKTVTVNKNSDGTEVTTTIAFNVVTFTTEAITNQECTVYVFGVRNT